ncbi:MAG: Hsp20/alpha crystallin family protein [Bryobacterales bacterium]|nr:Hsp20/alpha crystallin family protein [Bryobacterales bacterium]MDE0296156.1 Hsp20/alpha crystallin family protein [Bryobacterales bacterium]MDE0432734.1 Hsp20/alpha crystallin family protein [Bryobacterales bacterium]
MSLIQFTPRSFDRWFGSADGWLDDFFHVPATARQSERLFHPSVDIKEDNDKIVFKTDLPGVDEKDIKVTIEDGTLMLSGERKFEKETEKENFHRVERSYGSFRRSFTLPETVDEDKVSASYRKGVLELTLPKLKSNGNKVKVVNVN